MKDSVTVPLIFSVAFEAGTHHFLHVRAVSKSTPQLIVQTRGLSQDLIFLARLRGRPPNVQPFQRRTVKSASLEPGTSEASLQKYSARPTFPITPQLLFTSRLETWHLHISPPISSSRRFRPFVFGPLLLLPLRHCCLRYLP